MRAPLFLISLALSSAACSDAREYEEETDVASSTSADASLPEPASDPVALEEETEKFRFAYSWPAEVSEIPELAAVLQADAADMRASVIEEADMGWDGAEEQDWTPRQHIATQEWSVSADLPDFLSLSGRLTSYAGGAHGMYGVRSLVWDKKRAQAVSGIEVFVSPVALENALGAELCDALNAERAERRGEEIDRESRETFDACPGLSEASVLLASSDGKTFDRLTIYFGPYVAGPYAEGEYELDFPVTASVIDAAKPEFASAFSMKR